MKNTNEKIFEEIFTEEIISNESFRSKVLAGIIGFLIIVVLLLSIAFAKHFKDVSQYSITIEITLLILAVIFVRAIFVSRAAKKWNKYGVKAFILIRYINAFTEISIPSVVLIIYSFNLPSMYPLFTPVSLLYFLIIMLSALELDFKLCLFSGTMAALQYIIIALYLTSKPSEVFDSLSIFPLHIGTAALLFISGHTAGLITVHIKRGLLKYYKAQSERNEIQKLFGQQISREIVDELVENHYEVQSRTRFAVIMFIDIRNFSIFAQNKSPEEIISYQNNVFSFMIEIINKHKGIVNQIMGDGLMAIFGAPIEHKNDCQSAVNASLEIYKELKRRNEKGLLPETIIRIGINAGEVVTGNVGTSERKQYSVTGQPVIIAARLEQINKELNSVILISDEVYKRVVLENEPINHDDIAIKGVPNPITVYQIV
ncbi:MAG: adenylate/guanylate cyclase domain-containing protein [Ignavibacteriota bacterium]|nr:adenylate/guanylate cyclase domain-containing protein [Ignavibacteriota bacterium]MCO6446080.1 adenylate/guanylate cyclase domain-containing protein [Ignavibacterium album]MCZ2267942.1 adenylate/guanylate cyclase domain-containing protein [Ignavibacteriales bacterium]HMN16773.1 adenylate/guanylate cyclase domain-containing protein [Ignavibacteriaceae bacterium]QKK00166.1 MAG: adenylate/guanylate cyclase domain-containing protein [Ignavibacteriota bacterium]